MAQGKKLDRSNVVVFLQWAGQGGQTCAELARHFRVAIPTMWRLLQELERECKVIYTTEVGHTGFWRKRYYTTEIYVILMDGSIPERYRNYVMSGRKMAERSLGRFAITEQFDWILDKEPK